MADAWEMTPSAVDGAEPLGTVRLRDVGRSLWKTTRQSRGTLGRTAGLAGEALKITVGRSKVAPDRKDWRFTDATWSENAVYRRVMQYYLAWAESMGAMADSAQLDWRASERARFFMGILVSAAAPTNTLVGNPAALKRVLETGGGSMVSGLGNLVDDVRHNGGMPSQVKRGALAIGTDLAATPGAVVYRDEVCEVLQFAPTTPEVRHRPLVMIPPQINKYYFMDLAPGRSFIEYASAAASVLHDQLAEPDARARRLGLRPVCRGSTEGDRRRSRCRRSDDVNVLGLCAGGILTAGVLNYLAHERDERVRTGHLRSNAAGLLVAGDRSGCSIPPLLLAIARGRSRMRGGLDGPSLGSVFTWMRPNDLVWNYWVNNYLLGKDPPSFDILAWNSDATNLPAALHQQFLDIFEHNKLVNPGAFDRARRPGRPRTRSTVDTYVTGATTDHLTPWKGCYRTTQLLGGPSTFILSNAGHIASLVNPPGNPKAHFFAGPEPEADPDAVAGKAHRRFRERGGSTGPTG